MNGYDDQNVILVHDWLTGMRGGEKCLETACRRWPNAPLFTLLHRAGSVTPVIENRPLQTSWLQRLPEAHRYYRYLLPLMPAAVGGWRDDHQWDAIDVIDDGPVAVELQGSAPQQRILGHCANRLFG